MPTPKGLASKVDGGLAQGGLTVGISFKVSPKTFLVSDRQYRMQICKITYAKTKKEVCLK